jgi:ABC-type tungstate transport system substrate-binding protein
MVMPMSNVTATVLSTGVSATILIPIAIVIVLLLLFAIPIFERRLKKLLGALFVTFQYFVVGFSISLIVYILYYILKWSSNAGNYHSLQTIFKWIGIVIGGYIVLSIIGWIVVKIWNFSRELSSPPKKHKRKIFINWNKI